MVDVPPNQNPLPVGRRTWISIPPYYVVPFAAFDAATWTIIRDNALAYWQARLAAAQAAAAAAPAVAPAIAIPIAAPAAAADPAVTAATERLETVQRLIQDIPARNNATCRYIVYHYIRPRGVAVVTATEEPGWLTVRYILSDGSEQGIGMTLLEVAANESQNLGCNGQLRLIADRDDLVPYYQGLGFVVAQAATLISGPVMTLDPAAAQQWFRANNEWRLAANEPTATWR